MTVWVIAIMIAGTTRTIYHPVEDYAYPTRIECEAQIKDITVKQLGSQKTTCLEMERITVGEKTRLKRIGTDI